MGFVVLEFSQSSSGFCQNGVEDRVDSCENASGNEDLVMISKFYIAEPIYHLLGHS